MSDDLTLVTELEEHVVEIQLNRPEKLNAFSDDLRRSFVAALDECEANEAWRVIIVRGAGRAFSVGADIGKPKSENERLGVEEDRLHILDHDIEPFLRVWDSPKPVIAEVHGYCMGIGTILASCADLAYIADDAVLGWPALPIGGGMISPFWAWHVGVRRAKEMSFIIGNQLSGTEAAEYGFVNRAFPADTLHDETMAIARRIARVPSDLLRLKKLANNYVWNQQGFRESVRLGAAWDAIAHVTKGAASGRADIRERGLKEAIAFYKS